MSPVPRYEHWDPKFKDLNSKGWCGKPFGPLVQWQPWRDSLTKDPFYRWSCRMAKGHEGEHDCPAAQEFADWNDGLGPDMKLVEAYVPRLDKKTKPKGRSAAARALFGGR